MIDALDQPMKTTFEDQLLRRTQAIEALIAYMSVQEPLVTKFVERAQKADFIIPLNEEERAAEIARLRKSVIMQYAKQRLLRCYFCVRQALKLPALGPNIAKLSHAYSNPGAITRHFARAHLAFLEGQTRPDPCPICIP